MINQHIDLSQHLISHSPVRTVKKNVREKADPILLGKGLIMSVAGRHTWTVCLRTNLLEGQTRRKESRHNFFSLLGQLTRIDATFRKSLPEFFHDR